MEKYDSSNDTINHIENVRKYINRIRSVLEEQKYIRMSEVNFDINKVTLVDILTAYYNGIALPFYGDKFNIINKNSSMYFKRYDRDKNEMLDRYLFELEERGINHDKSKLAPPEKEGFDIWTPALRGTTYGSEEYKNCLKELSKVLAHHYKNNRHHPEHFENGIYGMNIIDLTEMICDWKAASERHNDGDIIDSISNINKDRFGYDDTMVMVLKNTTEKYF